MSSITEDLQHIGHVVVDRILKNGIVSGSEHGRGMSMKELREKECRLRSLKYASDNYNRKRGFRPFKKQIFVKIL